MPRSFVAVPNDDPAAFDERAFVAAVRKGRVVVSSGPFLRLEANGKGVGDTIPPGDAAISILVDAPPGSTSPRSSSSGVARSWGDWIVAVARGDRSMSYLHRPGARPFAFTNPIRVEF